MDSVRELGINPKVSLRAREDGLRAYSRTYSRVSDSGDTDLRWFLLLPS